MASKLKQIVSFEDSFAKFDIRVGSVVEVELDVPRQVLKKDKNGDCLLNFQQFYAWCFKKRKPFDIMMHPCLVIPLSGRAGLMPGRACRQKICKTGHSSCIL